MHESLKRFLLGLAVILGGFFAVSNLWLLSAGVGRTFKNTRDVPEGSVAVVLGASEFFYTDGKPQRSETYWQRIEAAADLAKTGRIKFIIASGEGSQTEKMANHLKAAGVTCPIVCDGFGNRTLDSVRRVVAGYPYEKIIFVSQEWHCDRALCVSFSIELVGNDRIYRKNNVHVLLFCLC